MPCISFMPLKARHTSLHPLLKIAEWLLVMCVSLALAFGLWRLLPVSHGSTGSLLTFQALQAIALFIVPAMTVAYLWSEQPLQWLHLADSRSKSGTDSQRLDAGLVMLSMGIILTAIPLINCLLLWNQSIRLPESMSALEQVLQRMEEQANQMLQGFLTYRNGAWWMLLINLLVLAVLPAIGEELTFRGVLQGLMTNGSEQAGRSHVAVWVTAFIFSFVHFQFYGFFPRLLLGVLLGYALAWSGRIGYSIVMHATNNAASVIVFYLSTFVLYIPQEELDALGTGSTWWLTAVCTPVMVVLLYLYYKRSRGHASV